MTKEEAKTLTYHVDTAKSRSRHIELRGKIRKEQEEEEELIVLDYLWNLGEMSIAPKIFELEILFKEKFGYKTYREAKERVKRTLNSLKNTGYLIKSPEEVHRFIRPSVEEFMRDAGLLATEGEQAIPSLREMFDSKTYPGAPSGIPITVFPVESFSRPGKFSLYSSTLNEYFGTLRDTFKEAVEAANKENLRMYGKPVAVPEIRNKADIQRIFPELEFLTEGKKPSGMFRVSAHTIGRTKVFILGKGEFEAIAEGRTTAEAYQNLYARLIKTGYEPKVSLEAIPQKETPLEKWEREAKARGGY